MLFDGAAIGAGAVVRRSVVGAGASHRRPATVVEDAVIGDGARASARGNELRAGARVWPGVELPDGAVRFSSDL